MGYEKTSVQNIIDKVGIAKGTFYYYFESKEQLVEVITSDKVEEASKFFYDTVTNHQGNAIEKANLFFQLMTQWKESQIDLLYTILTVLYSESNYFYLKKLKEQNIKYYAPILNIIVKQGSEEGVFTQPYIDNIGEVVIQLSNSFSDGIADIMLNLKDYEDPLTSLINKINVFIQCFERILGVEAGLLKIIDIDSLTEVVNAIQERKKNND